MSLSNFSNINCLIAFLCVSKSLASALDAIGFVSEAASINQYGESHLRGGIVDAIGRVGQYAETQLPAWVTRKVMNRPHMFDWQLLQEQMKDTILLGVLGELDGNGSQKRNSPFLVSCKHEIGSK